MKKVLLIVFAANSILFAQPTLNSSQVTPGFGDMLNFYNVPFATPSEGASQTWDYSLVTLGSPTAMTITNAASSGIPGIPGSSFCYSYGSSYDCYNSTSSVMQRVGISSGGVVLPFQNPETILHFPLTMGSSSTDNFRSTFTASGYPVARSGSVTNTVTGFGTLIVPGGASITNVLQVKSVETYTDSADLGAFINVVSYNTTIYNFYAANRPGYIMNFSTVIPSVSAPTNSGAYIEVLSSTVGIETLDLSNNMIVYPNPIENHFSIQNNTDISLVNSFYQIINMQGQVVMQSTINSEDYLFDVNFLENGLYTLIINGENFTSMKKILIHK